MKSLFSKKIRKLVESIILVLCLIAGVIVMFTTKDIDGETLNVWQRAFKSMTAEYLGEFLWVILICVNVVVNGIVIIVTLVKGNKAYFAGIIWTLITALGFFVIGNIFGLLTIGIIIALISELVLLIAGVVYHVLCLIKNPESFERNEEIVEDEQTKSIRLSKASKIFILVCSLICLVASLSSLFIPFFTITSDANVNANIPVYAITSPTSASLSVFITFIVLFVINLLNVALILGTLAYFKNDDGIFIKKSKNLINLNYGVSVAYFITGLTFAFFIARTSGATNVSTLAYIPFAIMSLVMIAFAIASVNLPITKKENKELKFPKVEMLIYTAIFTILPFISIYLNMIVASSSDGTEQVSIRAIDIVKEHSSLGSYQLTAFFIVVLLTLAVSLFVLTVAAFFKNKNLFYKLSMVTILADMVFVFAIGTFGYYYKIVQEMNIEKLTELFSVFDFSALDYTIESQTSYVFFGALILLVLVFIRNPLKDVSPEEFAINCVNSGPIVDEAPAISSMSSREEELAPAKFSDPESTSSEKTPVENEEILDKIPDFDACPSFSELDSKIEDFNSALEERKSKEFNEPTLVNLTQFIVDYARESRLHLSYTPEDVATFIAGLGACRLSILQGMSGTGKTSLPKIFMEAIMGNCEIIEVESSWRDKNELLGYYNQFSNTFTPKKFTEALYKAKLNEEVPTFIVLDEMNLSRIEYYFSDFLSLMENEEGKREIKLLNVKLYNTYDNEKHSYKALSEDHTIKIPSNIWFIGTANRDESTFEISDKVYDRAHTMNFNKRAPKAVFSGEEIDQRYLPYEAFANILNKAKNSYEFDIDKNPVVKEVERILSPYNISFGNRISGQIENFVKVYCSCFDNPSEREFEAVEAILLSKVVHKLENKSVENKEILIAEFNKLKLKRCVDFVSKLNEE